ncbi:fungal-specific transcription factor domain-containing protein [Xylariales sp. PMI_506]|nr:fungal-specific transcription factor domain-containing protein [Xylariales sp. PMI_506]
MSGTTSPEQEEGQGDDQWAEHSSTYRHREPPQQESLPQAKRRRLRRTRSHGTRANAASSSSSNNATQEIGLMRDGATHGSPRFIGSASGIHFIRTVSDVLARRGDRSGGAAGASSGSTIGNLVPGEDDQLVDPPLAADDVATPMSTSRAPFWRPDEVLDDTEPLDAAGAGVERQPPRAVSFDSLVSWTQSYFENWHPAFPFLHGPEVLELLERVAEVGIANLSDMDATIVRAIMSISLADARQVKSTPMEPRPTSLLFLSQDDTASGLVFALGSPASLKGIQAAVCVQLFMVSMLRFNMASRLGGIVVRMAFHLGLHRCPFRFPNFSQQEASMRKRVWWSIYCLERMVCQSLGHPLDIADDDVDVCLPTNEKHRKDDTGAPSKDSQQGNSQLTLLSLLSDHARLRGMILELRNKNLAIRNDTIDRAMLVQSELTRWTNLLNDDALGDDMDDEDDETLLIPQDQPNATPAAHKSLLLILQHEATIALNRPLLASKSSSPTSRAALQTCIGASRAIIDTIISAQNQQAAESDQNIMVWPLLTWSVWMSCFILVFAALEEVTTIPSAFRYAKKAKHILKQLSARGTRWPDLCLHAIEQLISALQAQHEETINPGRDQPKASTTGEKPRPAQPNRYSTAGATSSPVPRPSIGRPSRHSNIGAVSHENAQSEPNYPSDTRQYKHMTSRRPSVVFDIDNSQSARYSPTLLDADLSRSHMAAQDMHFMAGLYDQEWLDPLSAIDFSNFAQLGSSGFGFDFSLP